MRPTTMGNFPDTAPKGSPPALRVRNLRVALDAGLRGRPLVRGVSLSVAERQTVALVGESGSGKSLTALATVRLTPPGTLVEAEEVSVGGTEITVMTDSELSEVRGRQIAIVFQNPMVALNPVFTVGHQLEQVLRRHQGLRGRAARDRAVELLELVEMSDPARRARQYPFELSGGMLQRAMIAIALAAGPSLLIADEPTTALDTTLQAQIMELITERQEQLGMGLLLISHDLGVVASVADEVYVMYGGRIVEHADVGTIFESPAHPYTEALLRTVRELGSTATADLRPIPGVPPRLDGIGSGCPFAPRCPIAVERCRVETPLLRGVRVHQEVACHLAQA